MTATTTLALLGGDPAITLDQTEALKWPLVEQEELDAVAEVAGSGEWSNHPIRDELESEFAAYIGVNYALAHNNGTAALHACAFALGIGPGDEVICPATSYWATAVPVLTVGAIPVFADVEPVFLNLDPAAAEGRITPRTKAIVVCHRGGMPCDMDGFTSLAQRYGLKLIEDASHAHGSSYRGRKIGSWGDVAGFSMQTSKVMPSGEGGLFTTNEREYYDRAVLLGHYERIRDLDNEDRRFEHTGFGFKYRISPLHAAIGRVALAKLDERNARRNAGIQYLYDQVSEIPGFSVPPMPDHVERVYYRSPFMIYDPDELGGLSADRFTQALQAEGARLGTSTRLRHRGGLHTQPLFVERKHWAFEHPANAEAAAHVQYGPGTLPVTEDPPVNRVSLPRFTQPTPELLDQYVAAFRKVAANAGGLL